MMALGWVTQGHVRSMANALRAVMGTDRTYTPAQMAEAISQLISAEPFDLFAQNDLSVTNTTQSSGGFDISEYLSV